MPDTHSTMATDPFVAEAVDQPPVPRHGLDSLMITRATPEHVPYLRRLKESVMAGRYRPAQDEQGFARWRDMYCTDAYFHELLESPDSMLLCVGTLRDPVGMVVLNRRADHLEIDDLLVLHPRRGDGTRLIVACLRYAESWRSKRVLIDVYPGNVGTEGFLMTHGFERAGDVENDLGRPMHRYDLHIA